MKKICGMYNVGVMTLPQLLDIELCDVNYSVIFHIVAFQAWKWEVGNIVDVNNLMDFKMLNRWFNSIFSQHHEHGPPGTSFAHRNLPSGQFFTYFTLKKHFLMDMTSIGNKLYEENKMKTNQNKTKGLEVHQLLVLRMAEL